MHVCVRDFAAAREADERRLEAEAELKREQLRVQDRQAAAIEGQTAVMSALLTAMLQQQTAAKAPARE